MTDAKEIRTPAQANSWLAYEEELWLTNFFPEELYDKEDQFLYMVYTLLHLMIGQQCLSAELFANYQQRRDLSVKWEPYAQLLMEENTKTIADLFADHPELVELVAHRAHYFLAEILWLLEAGKTQTNDHSYVSPYAVFEALQQRVGTRLRNSYFH